MFPFAYPRLLVPRMLEALESTIGIESDTPPKVWGANIHVSDPIRHLRIAESAHRPCRHLLWGVCLRSSSLVGHASHWFYAQGDLISLAEFIAFSGYEIPRHKSFSFPHRSCPKHTHSLLKATHGVAWSEVVKVDPV